MKATGEEQPAFVLDVPTSGLNQSTQSSKLPRQIQPPIFECLCLATDLPISEKSFTIGLTSQDFEPPPCNCIHVWMKWRLWLQQHLQEFNSGPQSQMQQHRKSVHR